MESSIMNNKFDQLEAFLLTQEPIDCPVTHTFVPGAYIRQIFMPAGIHGKENLITSLIHNTTHPYFVLKGEVIVFSENDGNQILRAGDWGLTTPGTRRLLKIVSDCVWITVHPTSIQPEDDSPEAIEKAVNLIGREIINWRENEVIGGIIKNNELISDNVKFNNLLK